MQGDLSRVLVVCPAGLRTKWQSELMARFGEEFELMDSSQLYRFFADYSTFGPATRLRGICSLEALRREELATRIVEMGIQFDLVIIDEAHHMRNPETLSFDLGEILSEHADSLILLTATPVHLQSLDLFYLLNIMDPGQFESPEVFEYQLEPNRLLNRAISALSKIPSDVESACRYLDSCPSHVKENPSYKDSRKLVDQAANAEQEVLKRQQLALAIRSLSELNAFSLIFNRTRRKEVASGTVRSATVVNVRLTPLEAEIYSEVLKFARGSDLLVLIRYLSR
jgi:SNF2 family DNA or RNA helicase